MMIPAFLAKGSGAVALTWLYFAGKVSSQWIAIGAVDGVFAVLFLVSYWTTRHESKGRAAKLVAEVGLIN